MSRYRHLVVCAILFFVLFYGFANLVKAEPISADCDYEHVAMLFNAKGYVMIEVVDSWIMRVEIRHVVCTKNSTYGLSYAQEYDLVHDYDRMPWWEQVINMRDVAQAIRNYHKSQSSVRALNGSEDRVLTHPEHDLDGDGIKDILEVAIADAIASGRGDQYAKVFTQFSTAPTDDDVAIFERYGGVLTSQVFAIGSKFLGFYGNIPYNQIVDYAAANIRIGYIEGIPDPKEIELCTAYETISSIASILCP